MELNKKSLYWIFQIGGWFLFTLLNVFFLHLANRFNADFAISILLQFVIGVTFSHFLRFVIVKYDWLRHKIALGIPRILTAVFAVASVSTLIQIAVEQSIHVGASVLLGVSKVSVTANILNLIFVYILWSLVYYLVYFIENYKNAEIENLKWQASANEIELNKLKSQLNPHFIFNSMNSIRALVDENPLKAKDAITQLSNILRNTLLISKKKVVSFNEEFLIVKDYLNLEKVRFEERLQLRFDIDPGSSAFELPPLMIQTLVENGIKHGISKMPSGGEIAILSRVDNNVLEIEIRNTGKYEKNNTPSSGFGLENTRQRLELMFGEKATFEICNESDNVVLTKLSVPKAHVL